MMFSTVALFVFLSNEVEKMSKPVIRTDPKTQITVIDIRSGLEFDETKCVRHKIQSLSGVYEVPHKPHSTRPDLKCA